MARPPTGPALVHALDGSDDAKRKTEIILQTISGSLSIDDAAAQLGIARSYVFVLREQILAGAIAAAEPRTPGPKPAAASLETLNAELAQARQQVKDAERRAKDYQIELELERSRIEIATVLGPRLNKKPLRKRGRRGAKKHPPRTDGDTPTPT